MYFNRCERVNETIICDFRLDLNNYTLDFCCCYCYARQHTLTRSRKLTHVHASYIVTYIRTHRQAAAAAAAAALQTYSHNLAFVRLNIHIFFICTISIKIKK